MIIFVHEAGHLLVAKGFGVRVLAFSLGFGKRIWGFRRGETEYKVAAVPLGGYVKLGGEKPEETSGDPREFLNKPRWQRVLVYLAGPTMNILLAIVLFAGLFMVGIEVPHLPDVPPVVGAVEEGSSGARAGIQRGDRVLAVNGKRAESWMDVASGLAYSPDKPVRLRVRAPSGPSPPWSPRRATPTRGSAPTSPASSRRCGRRSSASCPGARPRRRGCGPTTSWCGSTVCRWPTASSSWPTSAAGGATAGARDRARGAADAIPVVPGADGRIGISLGYFQRYGPLRAFGESVEYNLQLTRETFRVLGKIFRRELSAKGALSGPIEIAARTGEAARRGFRELVHLMGFISLSIAILNLLPIPVLDGGQIAILLVESVIRRDLSLRLKEVIAQVGFVLILILMVTVLYFDIVKRLPGLFSGS